MATEKTEEQKKEEAKLRAEKRERQLLSVLKRCAVMEDESEIVDFLGALTHKVSASVIRKAAGDGMFPLEFGEWVIAQSADEASEIDVVKSTSTSTYKREKVSRDWPAKFDNQIFETATEVDDNGKETIIVDRDTVVNQELLECGTDFYSNLKQFLVDNKDNLDVFEKNGQYWMTYFRTDTEKSEEAKANAEAGISDEEGDFAKQEDESPI